MENKIDHPKHYGGDTTYEVVKVAEAWGFDKDAYLFNVLKYIARNGKKHVDDELEDLKKARWYLNRKISNIENVKPALYSKEQMYSILIKGEDKFRPETCEPWNNDYIEYKDSAILNASGFRLSMSELPNCKYYKVK